MTFPRTNQHNNNQPLKDSHTNETLNEEPNKPHRVKPGVIRAGGKSRLVDRLLPHVPKKSDHDCYCEPFAGGLALLLAKERSAVEVLNDLDGDLVTFYRCVRFHPEPLCTELEFVLNSRQEFMDFKRQPGLTDIQKAARWFFRNKVSFGGGNDSFGVACSSGGGAASSRESRMEDIRRLSVRLDRTIIENVTWEKCLELYDRPRTFFFCDPPYTECGKTAYAAWKESDVMKFREQLGRVKGRWMVTLNDCESNRRIFAGCDIESVQRALGIAGKAGAGRTYREIIIKPRR